MEFRLSVHRLLVILLCNLVAAYTPDGVTLQHPLELQFLEPDHIIVDHTHAQGQCGTCSSFAEYQQRRIELLKTELLSKLGLQKIPEVEDYPRIDEIAPLQEFINENLQIPAEETNDNDEEYKMRLDMIAIFASPPPFTPRSAPESTVYFSMSTKQRLPYDIVDKAHLFVYVRRPARKERIHVRFSSPECEHPEDQNVLNSKLTCRMSGLKQKKSVLIEGDGQWVNFVISKNLKSWLEKPQTNLGLVVEAGFFDSSDKLVGENLAIIQSTTNLHQRPLIQISFSTQAKRRRRAFFECKEVDGLRHCCKYPLSMNFTEMGWNFIAHPAVLEVNYCAGDCITSTTKIFGQRQPTSSSSNCCGASKRGDVVMSYYDEFGVLITGVVPQLKIMRCGCS